MSRNIIETVMGAVVLVVAGAFLTFAYNKSNFKPVDGYKIQARFDSVAGLSLGSDVRIGGIKIGVVNGLSLDSKNYRAVVTLQIKEDTRIPVDSNAAVVSDGLLGGKYVTIMPGAEDATLKEGESIDFTQSSVNLEDLIGKMVFSGGGVDGKKKDEAVPEEAPKGPAGATLQEPPAKKP